MFRSLRSGGNRLAIRFSTRKPITSLVSIPEFSRRIRRQLARSRHAFVSFSLIRPEGPFDTASGRRRFVSSRKYFQRRMQVRNRVSGPSSQPCVPWFERLVALVAILALLPVFVLIALIIKTTSPGPILNRRRRIDPSGTAFTSYTFRVRVADRELLQGGATCACEPDSKLVSDPALTSVGRFLQEAQFGGLPQLWNVLRGEMPLVGNTPRAGMATPCVGLPRRPHPHPGSGRIRNWNFP